MTSELVDKSITMATSHLQMAKAARYMKALCNHFSRKADASYEGNQGQVTLTAGKCEMLAEEDVLTLHVRATTADNLERMKRVIGDHLIRFAGDEALQVVWIDNS